MTLTAPGRRTRVVSGRGVSDGHNVGPSPLVLAAVLMAMAGVFLAVMPIRTYLEQHRTEVSVSRQLASLDHQDASLSAQISRLSSSSQVELIARTRYGLVEPGDTSYVILPSPSSGQQVGSVPSGSAVPASTTTTSLAPSEGRAAGGSHG